MRRRRVTVEEALDHAEAIVTESGAGALTLAEMARRMGIRSPSLYKYFDSLHAVYDALFARGNARLAEYVDEQVRDLDPGLERMLMASRAIMRWAVANPGLGALMFWRPVAGFEPSEESYALAEELVRRSRADLSAAVRAGDLAPHADSDEVFRLFTSLSAGLVSQQLANQPGADYDDGLFTSLTEQSLAMFVQHHSPAASRTEGRER